MCLTQPISIRVINMHLPFAVVGVSLLAYNDYSNCMLWKVGMKLIGLYYKDDAIGRIFSVTNKSQRWSPSSVVRLTCVVFGYSKD